MLWNVTSGRVAVWTGHADSAEEAIDRFFDSEPKEIGTTIEVALADGTPQWSWAAREFFRWYSKKRSN